MRVENSAKTFIRFRHLLRRKTEIHHRGSNKEALLRTNRGPKQGSSLEASTYAGPQSCAIKRSEPQRLSDLSATKSDTNHPRKAKKRPF